MSNASITDASPPLVEQRKTFDRVAKAKAWARRVSSEASVPWVKIYIHAGESTVIWLEPWT
jgi:hypothetical protein